ncbi:MAG: CaiB/BaiF CoA-transferase family protein [Candidatus Hydrogenedentes bacterium]|nr:CaiB/BaiF CoA-transferase family protein [Candidatus Hydrogenedentota bacterium]
MSGPLSGIKIIDCSRLLPGGFCTMLMGDLGADVIKVEEPGRGDYVREFPPFKGDQSYMHLVLNRNKRSMTLNLKSPEGVEILKKLVRDSDVIVEGFRPGVMDRLGVGYEALKQENPRLVYCAITGYGQTGPYAQRPGHDLNYVGIAGALEQFGPKDGPPTVPGLTVADIGGGAQMAIIGILAAIIARGNSGKGQFIDISMTDGVVYWLSLFAGWYFGTGISPKRGEHVLLGQFPCYAVYPAKDGYITVGCLEAHFWANLCREIGREQYIPEQLNLDDAPKIFDDLANLFRTKTRAEWDAFFADKNVCVGPVNLIEEAIHDPQLKHRGMFTTLTHSIEGEIQQLGIPIKLSATPGSSNGSPPNLGDHTREVLGGIGLTETEISGLIDRGIV